MITVHHLENSRSQRVLWLLEELGLEYDIVRYARDPRTLRAPASLRAVHPLGKSPTVVVDGKALIETGAIVEFLTSLSPAHLVPHNAEDLVLYRQYLHYAEGSMMGPLLTLLVLRRLGLLGRPARPKIQSMIDDHLDWLETELSQREWFAGGQFSAADIMMSFPLEVASDRADLNDSRPQLIDWLRRIHERPSYQAALVRGGPYRYSKSQPDILGQPQ